MPVRANLGVSMLLAVALGACSSPAAPPANAPANAVAAAPAGPPVAFEFEGLDGRPLSTASVAGRITVIGFVATYDVASQAEVRYLQALARHHAPRVNVALLVLEPPVNRPLVEAFAHTLGWTYPVAIADAATIAGEGPFAGLHHVPSVVVLDRAGREAWRGLGITTEDELAERVGEVERREAAAGP